jgi:maltose phosphorylase
MRIKNDTLSFEPKIPQQWDGYSFKVNFRNQILKVNVTQGNTKFELTGDNHLEIIVNGKSVKIKPNQLVSI